MSKDDVVEALGLKVVQNSMLRQAHPDDWRTVILSGRVQGKGLGRKTKVLWTLGNNQVESEVGARVLTVVQRAGGAASAIPAPVQGQDTDSESSGSDMDISSDGEDGEQVPVDNEQADPDDAPPEEALCPGGLVWVPEPDGVQFCARETSGKGGEFLPRLKWPRNTSGLDLQRTPIDFWLFLFPNMLDDIVRWTNSAFPARVAQTTKHEVVKFFGIQYAMTQYPTRQRHNYWSLHDSDLLPAPAFGQRFGMSRDRFEMLVRYMTFHDPDLDLAVPLDPWRKVRTFVNMFNLNRAENVTPGWVLVVDESTSKWRGLGDWYDLGMPHITKIPRKPEPVGLELKDMCDGESGIMLYLEIMEGKQEMESKEFCSGGNKAGTAHCLRCTKPWHGSGRVLVGDSAFASTQASIALYKHGIYFVGLVKTSTSMYPKRHLQTMPMAERGDTATFSATKDRVTMLAHVWNDPGKPGKPRKCLVSTFGTTLDAEPIERPRKRKREDGTWEDWKRSVKCTQLVRTYFKYAGAIDRHNRVRMDGIRMERTLEFKTWWCRVISSILGIIATDAFYAMRIDDADLQLDSFMELLASQMIFNTLDGSPLYQMAAQTRSAISEAAAASTSSELMDAIDKLRQAVVATDNSQVTCKHNIHQLRELEKYQGKTKVQLTCAVCKHVSATLYCADCSGGAHQKIVPLCGPATKKQCLSIHCAT